jgi:hypothetical protein
VIPPATTPVADDSTGVTVAHTGLQTGFLTFLDSNPTSQQYTSFTFDLFPFATPYKVYSGRCTWADPSRYGVTALSLPTTPNTNAGTFTVREPATNLRVQYNGTSVGGAVIYAYPTGTDCDEPIILGTTQSTGSVGKVAKPGLPFGDYQFCAQYDPPGSTPMRQLTDTTVVQNRTALGTVTQRTLNIPSSSSANGVCADPTPPVADDGS